MHLTLKRHPDTPCDAVTEIAVALSRGANGSLSLAYRATGKMNDVRWPVGAPPERTDALWKHTCFEAFVRAEDGAAYREFNLSPSAQWAAYAFDACRTGMRPDLTTQNLRIDTDRAPAVFDLRTTVALSAWKDAPWRLGLSAVIEETSGRKSYWALAHPPGRPDFHHADCFAAQIPAASPP